MDRSIAILGTLDTKGDQILYLKEQIQKSRHTALVIDVGILGNVPFRPEVTRYEIAHAAGKSIDEIIDLRDESEAIKIMSRGACNVIGSLYLEGRICGIAAVGGSMGTALALKVLDVLPLGLPKLLISTLAYSHALNPEMISTDLLMIPWVGGLWGINAVSRGVLDQAAGVIVGAVNAYSPHPVEKSLIGITSLGMTSSRYLGNLKPALEKRGYEASVYHATGMNVRFLEKAIASGSIDAVLELQAGKELINEVCGSVYGPGPDRFEAAAVAGIPQIFSTGIIESCLWAPSVPLPSHFKNRRIMKHNELLCMIPTSGEEKVNAARLMVKKLNASTGPCALLIPKGEPIGLKNLGFHDPNGVDSFIRELKAGVKEQITIIETKASADDPLYTAEITRLLDKMME